MILLIDNYDSFTYNLYQFLGHFEKEIDVVRNDALEIDDIRKMKPEAIILSPGPKTPREAGICMEVIQEFYDKIPILGICLGHQSIGQALGGEVIHAKELYHGKYSYIDVDTSDELFAGLPSTMKVARYHSLVVDKKSLPPSLKILSEYEGEIMAMRHMTYPVYGLQFHPESILTEGGMKLINNFLTLAKKKVMQEQA